MLTPFGKAMRRSREEKNVNLKKMAEALDLPSSYLSAIEHGRKPVSAALIDAVAAYFADEGMHRDDWAALASASPTQVKLDLTQADELEREVYMAVGRRFKSAPHEVKEEIRQFIRARLSSDDEVPRDWLSGQISN